MIGCGCFEYTLTQQQLSIDEQLNMNNGRCKLREASVYRCTLPPLESSVTRRAPWRLFLKAQGLGSGCRRTASILASRLRISWHSCLKELMFFPELGASGKNIRLQLAVPFLN